MNKDRRVKLSNIMFFDQRLRNIDKTFANCLSFVYAAVSYMELKQMTDKIHISVQRGARRPRQDGTMEYRLDDGFQVFDNVKNTPRYNSIDHVFLAICNKHIIFAVIGARTSSSSTPSSRTSVHFICSSPFPVLTGATRRTSPVCCRVTRSATSTRRVVRWC